MIFHKGKYSFASRETVLGSEQHLSSPSGATPEHTAPSAVSVPSEAPHNHGWKIIILLERYLMPRAW